MLIIRRRQGESISIGDDIEIEIVEAGPGRVKIGIHAPRHVVVQRAEVTAVRNRNLGAAALAPELRAMIARRLCLENSPKTISTPSDKTFEARYSGHPETEENPGSA